MSRSPCSTVTRTLVRELYDEGAGRSGLWEVTPGAFVAQNDGFAEYMHILEGRGTVLSDDGSALELRPGVKFIARSGWRGRWVVTETIRKIYVIWTEPQSDTVPSTPSLFADGARPSRVTCARSSARVAAAGGGSRPQWPFAPDQSRGPGVPGEHVTLRVQHARWQAASWSGQ